MLDVADSCPFEGATGSDANGDGCIDKVTGLPSVIAGLELPKGNEDALLASVKVVQDALQRGNAKAVRGVLKAFINKIAAQSGKKIPEGNANTLKAFAENILAQLP